MRLGLLLALVLVASGGVATAAEIAQVNVTPSAPPPGSVVTITLELRNAAQRPVPPGVIEVRVAGKPIGHITTPAMPPGGTARVSGGVTLPNVADKTLRLQLVPPTGRPVGITLTLTPRE